MSPELFASVMHDYTSVDPDPVRVEMLVRYVEATNMMAPGDYIEIGTLWGLSTKVIHRAMDPTCTLYAFDTFDGFDQRDLDAERSYNPKHPWRAGSSEKPAENWCFFPTSPERVCDYLGNPANFKTVKGWFPDTFTGFEDKTWRFAHIDADLFQPTYYGLQKIWPRLVLGGKIVVHDFANEAFNARTAVTLYCATNDIKFVVLDDYHHSVLIEKV